MSADVSIVIINYNTSAYTLKCIESIYRHSEGFNFEIVLIDNGSVNFDSATLAGQFPHVKIIENPVNLGFSKACNQGIASTTGEYVLLLNNDTELRENSILTCLDFLRSHAGIGVVSPAIIYPDGTSQRVVNAFPSILNELIELFRFTKILSKKFLAKRLSGRYFDYRTSRTADWVWGTFFMFKRELLDRLPAKKLNDAFFLYYEDVIWCYEFKEVGLPAYFLSTTNGGSPFIEKPARRSPRQAPKHVQK